MNNFQSIQSGQGMLKNNYEEEPPISVALRKRLKKYSDKVDQIITKPSEEESENE